MSVGTLPAPEVLHQRPTAPSFGQIVWRFCRRKPLGAIGAVLVLVMLVMAV